MFILESPAELSSVDDAPATIWERSSQAENAYRGVVKAVVAEHNRRRTAIKIISRI